MATESSKSTQRQTAEHLIDAFNKMDVEAILALRSADCMRYILPTSMNHMENNEQFRASMIKLKQIFKNFTLTSHDVIEDKEARRICMYLKARAETLAGEYINEYMWILDFDESGSKITRVVEFVDSKASRENKAIIMQALKLYAESGKSA